MPITRINAVQQITKVNNKKKKKKRRGENNARQYERLNNRF